VVGNGLSFSLILFRFLLGRDGHYNKEKDLLYLSMTFVLKDHDYQWDRQLSREKDTKNIIIFAKYPFSAKTFPN